LGPGALRNHKFEKSVFKELESKDGVFSGPRAGDGRGRGESGHVVFVIKKNAN
jgi:hypothetical protein